MTSLLSQVTFESLNFTNNCTLSATFEALRNETGDIPIRALVNLVRVAVPEVLTSQISAVSDTQIVEWYLPQHSRNPGSENITSLEGCRSEYCRALRWEGDPDMSGIGVFVSYLLESALILLLLPALAYFYFRFDAVPGFSHARNRDHILRDGHERSYRLWIALTIVLSHIWMAALLFAMGITISAIVFTCIERSAYVAAFSSLSTNIVVWPVLLPWPFYSPMAPRRRIKKLVITLLCILNVVENVIAFTISTDERSPFEKLCFSLAAREESTGTPTDVAGWENIEDAVLDLCAWAKGLSVTMAVVIICAWMSQWGAGVWERWHKIFNKRGPRPKLTKVFRIDLDKPGRRWPWVVMGLGGILLASSLVIFWMLRIRVRLDAGDSLMDNDWGFGQIASIVAWILVVAETVVVCIDKVTADKRRIGDNDTAISDDHDEYRPSYRR